MSLDRIQKHFQEEPIEYVSRGSEVKVYGTSKAVIRVADPLPSTPVEKGILDREALPQIKAGMGGLVVPFEAVEALDAYEVHGRRWFFWENRVPVHFTHPVIQERVSASTYLDRVIATADPREESRYLNMVLSWAKVAISRGFIPHDLVSNNFIVSGQDLLLTDLGAVHGRYSGRRNLLRNGPILARLAHNAAASFAPVVKDASQLAAFQHRLTNILSTASHKIRKTPSEEHPVPDLPL